MSYSPNYYKILSVLRNRRTKCFWFKDKRYYGMQEENMILVNPHLGEILSTICHECLHNIYPDFKEEIIAHMEDVLVKELTLDQASEILKLFTRKAKPYERKP